MHKKIIFILQCKTSYLTRHRCIKAQSSSAELQTWKRAFITFLNVGLIQYVYMLADYICMQRILNFDEEQNFISSFRAFCLFLFNLYKSICLCYHLPRLHSHYILKWPKCIFFSFDSDNFFFMPYLGHLQMWYLISVLSIKACNVNIAQYFF